MSDQSKTSKRLGIVGAAAVVGLVPISVLGAAPAFALSSASLSLSSQSVNATNVTATNGFTVGATVPATGDLVINSTSTAGGNTTATAVQLPTTDGSFTVSFTPPGGTATNDPVVASTVAGSTTAFSASQATLEVTNQIPANSVVTVTAAGAKNPTAASTVFFADSTSVETTAIDTNTVSIGTPTSTTPTVSGVNPTAFTGGSTTEPFTVTGTGFNTSSATAPIVCFVQVGTTIPAGGTATNPCPTPGTATVAPGTLTAGGSSTQLQGTSPALAASKNYNVVVYNFNDATSTYTAPSATSGTTLVGAGATTLNFIPESGIRAVDSRVGAGLPKGSLTPKTAYAIPLATFLNTAAVPTNVPATATGLSLNVTAVGPTGAGNLQVWSGANCATVPPSSTVNFQPPQDTNNSTFVPTAAFICVQDNGASVPVVMDVTGYTLAGGLTAPLPASRILDTRNSTGGLLGPLASGQVYRFNAVAMGLAAGQQVALNVTAVAPSSVGNLRVFPETTATPTVSNVPNTSVITYIPNTDASSLFVTQVGTDGYIDLYSAGTGTVNVVFDETANLATSSLKPVATPYRIYDSRPGGIAAGGTATVTAAPSPVGSVQVPAGSLGVVGDIGDINPAAAGNLRTLPQGGVVPGTSTINNFPMQTRSTSGLVALNPTNGQFSIYSAGSLTNSTFDVTGYIPNA